MLNGYACLPDMLWQCGARDFIESDRGLRVLFRGAAKQRLAKQANDSFVRIATTICALEILVRDFIGWGERFPAARHAAEGIVAAHLAQPRVWLLDMYLCIRSTAFSRPWRILRARNAESVCQTHNLPAPL